MHKILLAILLSAVFFFPKSEVFAVAVPQCGNENVDDQNPVQRDKLKDNPVNCPQNYICFLPVTVSTALGNKDTNYCYKAGGTPAKDVADALVAGKAVSAGGAQPVAGAVPKTIGTPTSGSGQRCWLDSKSPDYGRPVPAGHVPGIDPSTGKEYPTGIYTAIGCIPTEPKALVEGLLKYGTVAAGAIAFILMLLGALGLITAEGNPEAIKESQERFYSAIVGLLFIIFAVLLMQVIGVDILGLPGFAR